MVRERENKEKRGPRGARKSVVITIGWVKEEGATNFNFEEKKDRKCFFL